VIALARIAAVIAVLGTAIVYGTDAFCAMVLRPALADVDDRCLVPVMGYVHLYGDRRMPVPGALGIVGATASAALAAVSGQWFAAAAAGTAVGLLLPWLVLYARVSAPINRQLAAAARTAEVPPNALVLQRKPHSDLSRFPDHHPRHLDRTRRRRKSTRRTHLISGRHQPNNRCRRLHPPGCDRILTYQ